MSADSVAAVKREILVRHLETWAPQALHRGRRAAYVHGYADDVPDLAEAALRVFTEQSDLVRGRELTMLAIGSEVGDVAARLGKLPPAPGLTVLTIGGGTQERIGVALKAAGALRVPMLGFLDASSASGPPSPATLAALATGKPAEILVVLPSGSSVPDFREALNTAGFPLVAAVELAVSDDPAEIVVYATTLGKSLESFKDVLWAVDEFAGVRYRDPGDPERHLIDISLEPHPGPLRRELLAHLGQAGSATVAELRTFALTETVYRASDATRVVHALLDAGSVTRRPEQGRLGGDVVISL
ncbi:hypothetical protein GCM10010435_05340 [Winogradskya consettensis]|uniref:Uncharacterized protein n=1 Tax=Winogradskya consettensis TaxID=113560 RepID=A0A919W4M6_9ACTN|nr:hypothetical protein [Actinoplanes consettensis]GIM79543.1 hypothetical protein Aco04nite_66030 [Actinoplanes consettensis]